MVRGEAFSRIYRGIEPSRLMYPRDKCLGWPWLSLHLRLPTVKRRSNHLAQHLAEALPRCVGKPCSASSRLFALHIESRSSALAVFTNMFFFFMTTAEITSSLFRCVTHRRRQTEADSRLNMDAYSTLFDFVAHVGVRTRRCARPGPRRHAQTEAHELDPGETPARAAHHELHLRLERRPSDRRPGRCLRTR